MALPMKPLPPNETLSRLLAAAKSRGPMTKDERDAQRMSWVIGEMMLAHPEMPRDEAVRIYREVTG